MLECLASRAGGIQRMQKRCPPNVETPRSKYPFAFPQMRILLQKGLETDRS